MNMNSRVRAVPVLGPIPLGTLFLNGLELYGGGIPIDVDIRSIWVIMRLGKCTILRGFDYLISSGITGEAWVGFVLHNGR